MAELELISNSPAQTIELGSRIGRQLKGGEVIGFLGAMGSGKTQLIKGIAAGAGAGDAMTVNSPTFVIVNEYSGRLDIYHIDAYRLASPLEFEMVGFDDFCRPQSVVMIEWAGKVESVLSSIDYIRIELFHTAQTQRKIHIKNIPDYIKLADNA